MQVLLFDDRNNFAWFFCYPCSYQRCLSKIFTSKIWRKAKLIKVRRLTRSFGFCLAERTVKLMMDWNIANNKQRPKTMSSCRFSCRIPLVTQYTQNTGKEKGKVSYRWTLITHGAIFQYTWSRWQNGSIKTGQYLV